MGVLIKRHCVESRRSGLSKLQEDILGDPHPIRIVSAPTGAGKSYAFIKAIEKGERVFFMVPTRRLAQNLRSSMVADLISCCGWRAQDVESKVAIWTSDETKRLKNEGVRSISDRRMQQVLCIDPTLDGGEIVILVPEVISSLLLRPFKAVGNSDFGVLDIVANFDHVVFDEFHTIESRGFGLAALFSILAASPLGRARLTFLSATPIHIKPTLLSCGIPDDQIGVLSEKLVPHGRVVHGDIDLRLEEAESMGDLLERYPRLIRQEIRAGRQVVVVYDRLADLKREENRLESWAKKFLSKDSHPLIVDSIDDSTSGTSNSFFEFGRDKNPLDYSIVVSTSSIELGVTLRSNLLFMDPGFEPMNFLQRFGRVSRGDASGHVLVRIPKQPSRKKKWLRRLEQWINDDARTEATIEELTKELTAEIRSRFKKNPEVFGSMPNSAAFSAGLFWHVLMDHFSNRNAFRRKKLRPYDPPQSRLIAFWLQEVERLTKIRPIGRHATTWIACFKAQVSNLRDIDPKIKLIWNDGKDSADVSLPFLIRETSIPEQFPLLFDENGQPFIELDLPYREYWREPTMRRHVTRKKRCLIPFDGDSVLLEDDCLMVHRWISAIKKHPYVTFVKPEIMEALISLVRTTQIVPMEEDYGLASGTAVY